LAKSGIRRIKFSVYGNPNQGQYDQLWKCFGDKSFLVKCFEKTVEIYYLDKKFPLAYERKKYKNERDRLTEERSRQREIIADRIVLS
jgi:hypothetical protein